MTESLTVPSGYDHTEAVVAVLDAAGITTGNGTGKGLTVPYVVVYSDLGALDGPMGDRFADLDQALFVHGVGDGPEQAQVEADRARAVLLTNAIAVDGRAQLYLSHESSRPVDRDDSVAPPLFYAVDEYHLATTPA